MYKLIKIDNYPIIINDKEPEDRKFCVSYHKIYKSPILDFYYQGDPYVYPVSSIIASNHPKTNGWFPFIKFSDKIAKKLGIIDVEKLLEKKFPLLSIENDRTGEIEEENLRLLGHRRTYENGYNQAIFDNKDKQFTLDDIERVIDIMCNNYTLPISKRTGKSEIIQSLTKQEYEVELEMEMKYEDHLEGFEFVLRPSYKEPKITNNSVKVIKLL